MIKRLKTKFECGKCGSIIFLEREVVIDELTKKLQIIEPRVCKCGNETKTKFKLLDVEI